MSTCQEPTGIGAQDLSVQCGDAAGVFCPKCNWLLCEYHLKLHEHRHEVLDKLKVPTKKELAEKKKGRSDEW